MLARSAPTTWASSSARNPKGTPQEDEWFLHSLTPSGLKHSIQLRSNNVFIGFESSQRARATVKFAFNPVSQSIYMRYGMYPREPAYFVETPPERILEGARIPKGSPSGS